MEDSALDPEQAKIVDSMLLQAVTDGNYDRIDLLLKKGADIDARNDKGRTPLMMAVWRDNPSMVQHILARKPSLFLKDKENKTAFDLIAQVQSQAAREKITDMMLNALPDHVRRRASTPVQAAAMAEAEAVENERAAREKAASDVTTGEAIIVSRPITLPKKTVPKGFSL